MNNFVDHLDPTKSLGSMNIKAQYLIMKRRAILCRFSFFTIDASFFSTTCCPLTVSIIKKRLICNINVNQSLMLSKDDVDSKHYKVLFVYFFKHFVKFINNIFTKPIICRICHIKSSSYIPIEIVV